MSEVMKKVLKRDLAVLQVYVLGEEEMILIVDN